jgi:hypothetical protein
MLAAVDLKFMPSSDSLPMIRICQVTGAELWADHGPFATLLNLK